MALLPRDSYGRLLLLLAGVALALVGPVLGAGRPILAAARRALEIVAALDVAAGALIALNFRIMRRPALSLWTALTIRIARFHHHSPSTPPGAIAGALGRCRSHATAAQLL